MPKANVFYGFLMISVLCLLPIASADGESALESYLQKNAFPGGVVLQIHAKDHSALKTLIRRQKNVLGHILLNHEKDVHALRQKLYEEQLHGQLSVSQWSGGPLPFVPNFVNLVISESSAEVEDREILRVLAPKGTALIGDRMLSKPRPDTIDDWPQYLYDAAGNAVSKDKEVKPPLDHLQWVGGPRWSRNHDLLSSVSACVSGDGKVFYIFDEGNSFSQYLPSHWKLIARDAFNGVILWKHDIPKWVGNLYRFRSGPANLPRRIVVTGKRLYATLGIEAPVSVIDTDSGKILETISGTENTEEILDTGDYVYFVADCAEEKKEFAHFPHMVFPGKKWIKRPKHVMCYDPVQERILWENRFQWVAPLTLAARRDKVYLFDGERVVALHKQDGQFLWESEMLSDAKEMMANFAPKLVVQDGVVLFSGGEGYPCNLGKMTGLSNETGKTLWSRDDLASGFNSPEDLFVIKGEAWNSNVTAFNDGDPAKRTGEVRGLSLGSGRIENSFECDVEAYWCHHRCHPGRSTEDYMILSRTGTEFVNLKTGEWSLHHWVRGACAYGIMPANGMLYAPQHPCACYIGAMLNGFSALRARDPLHITSHLTPKEQRWPNSSTVLKSYPHPKGHTNEEWPTYRQNTRRSGQLPGQLKTSHQKWSLRLNGKLTQPVIAGQKVLVANKSNPALLAYNAQTGLSEWQFFPESEIDSPPAIYKGLVYFGTTSGMIYCLNLTDGSEVWRVQGAPSRSQHMYFEKLGSTHPVHGNVLVMNDRVYTVAGRSMFTDGGMRFLVLDALTGKRIHEHHMGDKVPGTNKELQMTHNVLNMPVALPDLLSSNGKKIFMRYQSFDLYERNLQGALV